MSRSLASPRLPLGGIEAPAPSARRPAMAPMPAALLALVAVLVLPLAGSLFPPGPWYAALDKPFFTPPAALVSAGWTLVYALNAAALYLLLRARPTDDRRLALGAMGVQLGLNLLWMPVFFGAQALGAGLGVVVLLALAILAAQFAAQRVNPAAAWLLLPTLAWTLFAALLNLALWALNP